MAYLDTAQAIADLGALVIIASVSVGGGIMMFRSVLKNNDKLAPVIDRMAQSQDRLVDTLDEHGKRNALLQEQAEEMAQQLAELQQTLRCHDTESANIDKKTLEILENISWQLIECIGKKKG